MQSSRLQDIMRHGLKKETQKKFTYKIKLIIDSWADVLDSKGHNDTQTFLSRKSTEVISAPGRKRLMRKEQFARNLVSDLAKREGSSTITIHVQVARKSVGIKHAKPPMMNIRRCWPCPLQKTVPYRFTVESPFGCQPQWKGANSIEKKTMKNIKRAFPAALQKLLAWKVLEPVNPRKDKCTRSIIRISIGIKALLKMKSPTGPTLTTQLMLSISRSKLMISIKIKTLRKGSLQSISKRRSTERICTTMRSCIKPEVTINKEPDGLDWFSIFKPRYKAVTRLGTSRNSKEMRK